MRGPIIQQPAIRGSLFGSEEASVDFFRRGRIKLLTGFIQGDNDLDPIENIASAIGRFPTVFAATSFTGPASPVEPLARYATDVRPDVSCRPQPRSSFSSGFDSPAVDRPRALADVSESYTRWTGKAACECVVTLDA